MDKDHSGEVTFEEFVKATIGTAKEDAFDCYRDEKDSDQFGTDLYLLLSRFRRAQLLKNFDDANKKGDTMSSYNNMLQLHQNSFFTVSMGGITKKTVSMVSCLGFHN